MISQPGAPPFNFLTGLYKFSVTNPHDKYQATYYVSLRCYYLMTYFPGHEPKWSHDEFNKQITNFKWPWDDDFMVHSVNQPFYYSYVIFKAICLHFIGASSLKYTTLTTHFSLLLLGGGCTCGTTLLHTSWEILLYL